LFTSKKLSGTVSGPLSVKLPVFYCRSNDYGRSRMILTLMQTRYILEESREKTWL
jgi:hypothetical protein